MTGAVIDHQVRASDPAASVFVTANAGSGKTTTLVARVARLLLQGESPGRILCVTYTKAAAAEMQRRLFEQLGDWSVMKGPELAKRLARIENRDAEAFTAVELQRARALFARALETPGGLKIQTIHAFCEKLLRRFPLEAGVSPRFEVLEDAAAQALSARAREAVALAAVQAEDGPLGRAFAHFAVELDPMAYEDLFRTLEARRADLAAYLDACDAGEAHDPWALCGVARGVAPETIEAEALASRDLRRWTRAQELMAKGSTTDRKIGAAMAAVTSFDSLCAVFCTTAGTPRVNMATQQVPAALKTWLHEEQARVCALREQVRAARIAGDTIHVLTLAGAYAAVYEAEKAAQGGLDFADLIAKTCQLLTTREDAAWVLFKLDGGIDHILLDEAQDTAPEQWEILRALTEDFFAGAGARAERDRQTPTLFVVGDEKQSIYSFQGARPERLEQEAVFHLERIAAGGAQARRVPLHTSYRSTPHILQFVDAAFAPAECAQALTPGRDARVEHVAARIGHVGSVDLWPLEQDEPKVERDAWDPVDADFGDTARRRLARGIAREIAQAVSTGEGVYDKDSRRLRPAGFGDFLILVRKRDALFEEIIRALKQAGVPVAGADRLTLSDHIVFDDLTGLIRWGLYPRDELTLAALLRSPFCSVDEDSLFDLAWNRRGDLWRVLEQRAGERAEWGEAHAFLSWVRSQARSRTPFDFLGRVLNRLDAKGRSMRARFLDRLGREAEEAIDELMAQALAAEGRGATDLEGLLAALDAAEVVVKRELEGARDEVRVMTVHGAKGLEAPIVILPDTTSTGKSKGSPVLQTEDGAFLFAPRAAEDCSVSAEARRLRDARGQAESLRLLYVALTRARDRLILCGRIPATRGADKSSWRAMLEAAFERPEIADHARWVRRDARDVRRYGEDPQPLGADARAVASRVDLPAWTAQSLKPEPGARWASPSSIADFAQDSAPSPLADRAGLGRFRRGELIHRLFEILPDLAPAARQAAARRLLGREPDLDPAQVEEMTSACLAVLDDPRFAAVFGPGSRAEAALAGASPELPPGLKVSGRMDRLVVSPDRVLVIDYKTNRPAPDRVEDVDPAYLAQMAAYVAVLRALYKDRRVEAALVWTDGPRLTPLPDDVIAAALARIRNDG
jgi:ATP-dependent helicase/nuclease subunit A